jgi:hypothetical protein
MPEQLDQQATRDHATTGHLDARLRATPGLASLVAEAEATWRARAAAAGLPDDGHCRPGWRTFEDSFPTFYEFTNRPR